MSKAVKTVVSVAAAVAIPFAAPAIASSIGLSAAITGAIGSATAGAVLGGAITGAALGAAKGAILGEDIKRSALMGGIGGGIAGYASMPSAPSAPGGTISNVGSGGQTAGLDMGAGTTTPTVNPYEPTAYGTSVPTNTGAGMGLSGTQTAGLSGVDGGMSSTFGQAGQTSTFLGGPTAGQLGVTEVPAGTMVGGRIAQGPMSVAPDAQIGFTAGQGVSVPAGAYVGGTLTQGPMSVAPGYGVGSSAFASRAMTPGTFDAAATIGGAGTQGILPSTPNKPTTFVEAAKAVPGEIAAKFTDPKALADLTLRAAGTLAGSVVAGDGLSDQERALLDAQTQELRTLQQTNAGLFTQRLEQAQNLIGESKYFDPEYFGLQRARRAQVAAGKAKRAGLRGLEGTNRAAESRRFDLATARDVGSSFDQGYLSGVQGRLGTLQAGMNAMPTGYPSSMGDYTSLRQAYSGASERARQTQRDVGDLFGSISGRGAAGGRG